MHKNLIMRVTPLKLIIGAAIGYGIYTAVKAGQTAYTAQNLLADVVGFVKKSFKVDSEKFSFDVLLKYTNPTTNPLTVNQINLDTYLGSSKLAEIREQTNFTVQPVSEARQQIKITVFWKDLGLSVLPLFYKWYQTGSFPFPDSMRATGSIQGNGFLVPVNNTYPLI